MTSSTMFNMPPPHIVTRIDRLESPFSASIAALMCRPTTSLSSNHLSKQTPDVDRRRRHGDYAVVVVCPSIFLFLILFSSTLTFNASIRGTWVGIGGYVGLDHGRRNIIISLRGSSNVRNFVLNILFGWTDYNLCEGCMVHTGFSHGWEQINNIVTRALKTSRATHPDYRLVVTGHSLGGAVATLAAAHLRSRGYEVDCYTFGAPRVGNDAFANFVTSQSGGSNWRLTHYDDPVPRLPPMFLGYRHLSPEYWLAGGPSRKVDYQPGDVKICEGIANVSCNAGDVFGFDILGSDLIAHFNYLRDVVGCASFPFGASDAAAGDDGGRLAEWSRKDRELIAGLGGRSDGQQS